jgi:hypothetical protein
MPGDWARFQDVLRAQQEQAERAYKEQAERAYQDVFDRLYQTQGKVAQVHVEVAARPALAVRIICPVCSKVMWNGMSRSGGDLRNANWAEIEPHLRKHVQDDGAASATVTVEVMVDL